MNQKIKDFLNNAKTWKEEYELLHSIISDCGLVEDFKWMHPCYTYNKANVVLIHGFKEYCAIAFFKGALLSDSKGVLIQQTENVQSGRQIRFKSLKEIEKNESIIKSYIFEAIEIEKAGLKVELKKRDDIVACEELLNKFKEDEKFKKAFHTLTPGRQKAYHLFFNDAAQSKTRVTRIEKYVQRIMNGKGLTDCTCGLSKRMPNCDGSHKQLLNK